MATEVHKNNLNVDTENDSKFTFKILASNIRSIFNKVENFEVDLNEIKPDMVCLSETWLNKDKRPSFNVNGYHTVA